MGWWDGAGQQRSWEMAAGYWVAVGWVGWWADVVTVQNQGSWVLNHSRLGGAGVITFLRDEA